MSTSSEAGVFNQVFGSCGYKDQLHIMSIKDGMTLIDMHIILARKWSEINVELFSLQYIAPHIRLYVTLIVDDDVMNMVLPYLTLKVNIVDILVNQKDELSSSIKKSSGVLRDAVEEEIGSTNASHNKLVLISNSIDARGNFIYGDAQEFRIMLKNYAMSTLLSFKYKKNDNKKVIAVCSDENCKWRIYASRHEADKLFGIRKCNLEHTCGEANLQTRGHPKTDSA